jgi:hypothetical protein
MTGSPVLPIEPSRVGQVDAVHSSGKGTIFGDVHQQMEVVAHQYPMVKMKPFLALVSHQNVLESLEIFIFLKNPFSVIPSIDHMINLRRQTNTSLSWHVPLPYSAF